MEEEKQPLVEGEEAKVAEKVQLCKIGELFQFLHGPDRVLLFFGSIACLCSGLAMPIFVFFFGRLTDSFDPEKSGADTLHEITKLSKIFLMLGGIVWICSYIFFTFWGIVSEKCGYEYKYRYLHAVLKQEAAWFDENDAQELPSKISTECAKIQGATGEKFIMIYNSMFTSLGGFIVAFVIGWKYALAALGTIPFLVVGMMFLISGIKKGHTKSYKAYTKSGAFAEQALSNIKVVAAFGQERREIHNYVKHLDEAKKEGQIGKLIIAFSMGIFNLLIFASYAYGLFVGGIFVKNHVHNPQKHHDYTSGDIISTFFGIIIGIITLGTSVPNVKAVSEGRIAAYTALQVINRQPKILLDNPMALSCNKIQSNIEFKNVTFGYSASKEKALKKITCTIEQGKTTAFVGPSGSGKSTIVKLLERFYDPEQGEILVNGDNLKQLNLREYRKRIGYVGQEPVLFNESIKANMLNSKPDATDNEIDLALKRANAFTFVQKLALGTDTNAGTSGGQLSGGEKQRIALARAFLKEPDLLILDEATSALDRRNELEVQKAIDAINHETNITTVVIAHRLSTIKKADRIYVIDKGEIKEIGNHESLLRDFPDGIYAQLVNTQTSEVGDNNEDDARSQKSGNQEQSKGSLNADDDDYLEEEALDTPVPMNSKKSANTVKNEEKDITKEVDKEDDAKLDEINNLRVQRKKQGFFKRLLAHNKPTYFIFIGLIAAIVVGGVFPTFAVFWTKVLFVMMDRDPDRLFRNLLKYCGVLLLIGFVSLIATFTEKFSFGCLGENMSRNLREESYSSMLRKHVGWYDSQENTTGQLTTILSTEVNQVNGASTESISIMFQSLLGLIYALVLALIFEWRITLVALSVVPIMMITAGINSKVKAGSLVNIERTDSKVNSIVSDTVINYTTVASFANENLLIEKYKESLLAKTNKEICKCHVAGFVFGFSQFMQFGMYAIMFWAGAKFVENNGVDGQDLFTAIYVMMFAAIGAGQAQQHGPNAGKGVQSAAKIYDIIDEPSEIDPFLTSEQDIIATKETVKGEIEFKNVWFRYPTRKDNWILKGLNMKFHTNECVGLVGQSGSGKSTIIQLLFRFYDPQRGQILVDGHDIKAYNIRSLRAQFGLVQQEPVLFNYSVRENICYGKSKANSKEIIEAAETANAHQFISERDFKGDEEETKFPASAMEPLRSQSVGSDNNYDDLPDGYNASCGIKGGKFSGGQKQRIAVARAIISQPQILMLDEATSALDEESQRKVQEALDKIMVERTSIVIAHRLTTIKKCDRLIVLDQGVVCEEGTYDELINLGGQFSHISSDMQS